VQAPAITRFALLKVHSSRASMGETKRDFDRAIRLAARLQAERLRDDTRRIRHDARNSRHQAVLLCAISTLLRRARGRATN